MRSTTNSLTGGYVIVDDYHVVSGCRNAIGDFLSARKIPSSRLSEIDGVGVFWQKTSDLKASEWELLDQLG